MTSATTGLRPLLLFLVVLWAQFLWILAPSWSDATYYSYGWLIGPVVAVFAWGRWQYLPDQPPSAVTHRWPWFLVAAATLFLIPLRILEHVDIYWRLPLWIHAATVLGITHLTLALVRGRKASIALLPATLFLLLAVPLPSAFEQRLVHSLTQAVIELASACLPIAGYPAVVLGSSFVVRGELLDVTDGCSGIRSFQSCAMATLALGELFHFSIPKRLTLLLLGLGIAIVGNACRLFALTRLAYTEGRAPMEAAHDDIGTWAMILTYLTIALFAYLLTLVGRPKTQVTRITK